MMKYFQWVLITMFLISSCKGVKMNDVASDKKANISLGDEYEIDLNHFRVVKIDSVKNIYMIYLMKNDSYFKIVSKKEKVEECNEIKLNKKYNFYLESLFPKKFLGKYDLSPQSIPHLGGIDFYGVTVTLEGDSINNLYVTNNLRGLCLQ